MLFIINPNDNWRRFYGDLQKLANRSSLKGVRNMWFYNDPHRCFSFLQYRPGVILRIENPGRGKVLGRVIVFILATAQHTFDEASTGIKLTFPIYTF